MTNQQQPAQPDLAEKVARSIGEFGFNRPYDTLTEHEQMLSKDRAAQILALLSEGAHLTPEEAVIFAKNNCLKCGYLEKCGALNERLVALASLSSQGAEQEGK